MYFDTTMFNSMKLLIYLIFIGSYLCYGYAEENFYFETVEEQPAGRLIGKLPSLSTAHKYRVSGNEESKRHIELDILNGTVKVKQRIDRESLKSDQLILALVDEENLSVKTVKIHVNDINDNDPQFSSPFYNVSIIETALLGTQIPLPTAFDPDKSENGTITTYQLQLPSNTFSIASTNENESASLYLTSQLDFRIKQIYELVLLAFDGGKPNRQGQITIFINVQDSNEAPRFEDKNYNVTTNAKPSINLPLFQIKSIDNDSGKNGEISYQIQNDPTNQFTINKETGEIFVKPEVEFLNCNKSNGQNTCLLTIEAIDGGDPPLKAKKVVRIFVNESNLYTPQILVKTYPLGYPSAFVDSNAKPDTVVAVLTIKDNDYGLAGISNLSIVSGNEGKWFRLESRNNFGIIRVVHLEPIEVRRFYELIVEAQDKGTPQRFSQQFVKLTIYDDTSSYKYLDEQTNQMYSICQGLPCYNGICNPKQGCQCSDKYTGNFCNERTFGFKFGSSFKLKLPENVNKFLFQFNSASNNGLLLYSQNDSIVELLNGNLLVNNEVSIPLAQNENYTTLTLLFNGNTTSILFDSNETKLEISQNLLDDYIFIGAIPESIDHQILNPNFYGCIKSLKIDDQPLNESLFVTEHGMMQTCPLHNKELPCSSLNAQKACQGGRCVNTWEGYYCLCDDGFESMDCQMSDLSVSSAGATIFLQPSQYSRQKLTSSTPNNKQLVHQTEERVFYESRHNFSHTISSNERIDNWPSQWLEMDLRTGHKNFTILKVKSRNENSAELSVMNDQLIYSVIDTNGYSVASLQLNAFNVSDRKWHRLTIEIASNMQSIRLQLDDQQISKIMHLNLPQFLSNKIDHIEIGSDSFYGCIKRFLLNNQLYVLSDSNTNGSKELKVKLLEKQFFKISSVNGTVTNKCSDRDLCSMSSDCMMKTLLTGSLLRDIVFLFLILMLLVIGFLIGLKFRQRVKKRQRLKNNIQRISNLQLISSTCESEFGHDNVTYNSNMDFNYLPSYIPVYDNILSPQSDICSCHLKFDYEGSVQNFMPNQYFLQDGVVTKFSLNNAPDSQHYSSISSSSTDIPLDPSLTESRLQNYSWSTNR